MKLLYCKNCHDIFKLTMELRSCECGNVEGSYSTRIQAEFKGDDAVPLGIQNSSFMRAIKNQPVQAIDGKSSACFEAFVIPKKCPTMVKG